MARLDPLPVGAQQLFVEHFISLRCLNGAEAARRAGVSATSAKQQASKWLRTPAVQKQIQAYRDERQKQVLADAAQVLEELLFQCHSKMFEVIERTEDGTMRLRAEHDIPEHAHRAIKKITTKRTVKVLQGQREDDDDATLITTDVTVEMHDKPRCLQLLMAHLGITEPKEAGDGKDTLAAFLAACMPQILAVKK